MTVKSACLSLQEHCSNHNGNTTCTRAQVFCLPMRKAKAKRTGQAGAREKGAGQQCGVHTYESRLRLVFAQQALVGECGMEGITPKVCWGWGVCVCVCGSV